MRPRLLWIVIAAAVLPAHAEVAMRDDFLVRNTRDLIDLCAVNGNDPLYDAAIPLCQGYPIGVYSFHQATMETPERRSIACPPRPQPSRHEGAQRLVIWAQTDPQPINERPADSLFPDSSFTFLTEAWPCRR